MSEARASRRTNTPIEPVSKRRDVALPPEKAFELFTARMGEWWPARTHSVTGDPAIEIRFEEHVGGRVVERLPDGTEHPWAEILAWDPPHRFVLSWHPQIRPSAASLLEVRFEPGAHGGSVLHLEHRGWEEFGLDDGTAMRDNYLPGWDVVIEAYLGHAIGG